MNSLKNYFVFFLLTVVVGCSKNDSNPIDNGPTTKLTGTVTDILGVSLQNVKIYTEPSTQTVTTDQTGKFEITGINAGFYTVFAEQNGFLTENTNTIVRQNETTQLNITLRILMSISGKVVDDSTGEAVSGVAVTIQQFSNSVYTATDGSYRFENIPAGTNIITLSKTGYIYKKASINIVPNSSTSYDISITKLEPLDMVFVEGGTFQMGDNFGDGDISEKPVHEVTISDFYISKTEITQKEWIEITSNNPAKYWADEQPVESISWKDAINYCNARSLLEGLTPCYTTDGGKTICDFSANGYRLPTEAEWEYAARGGIANKNFKYSGSTNINDVAWYDKNSSNITHPVAQRQPNDLGIYDMCGNVWEFCWDYFNENYYSQSPRQDPAGPELGDERIMRGGAWSDDAYFNRIFFRNHYKENARGSNVGLRVVRRK